MSRRPPSQRNAEYGVQHLARQAKSMIPGTAGGRLASAAPAPPQPSANLSDEQSMLEDVNTVAASGTAQTLPDVTVATVHYITLTGNCTFTFPAAEAGKSFTVVLVQDGTGSRTVTWPASVKWPGGTAPTLTTAASKRDVFSFLCPDDATFLGFAAGFNYS